LKWQFLFCFGQRLSFKFKCVGISRCWWNFHVDCLFFIFLGCNFFNTYSQSFTWIEGIPFYLQKFSISILSFVQKVVFFTPSTVFKLEFPGFKVFAVVFYMVAWCSKQYRQYYFFMFKLNLFQVDCLFYRIRFGCVTWFF
jgi:hypothetical protein